MFGYKCNLGSLIYLLSRNIISPRPRKGRQDPSMSTYLPRKMTFEVGSASLEPGEASAFRAGPDGTSTAEGRTNE
jgi:hypothetical protein